MHYIILAKSFSDRLLCVLRPVPCFTQAHDCLQLCGQATLGLPFTPHILLTTIPKYSSNTPHRCPNFDPPQLFSKFGSYDPTHHHGFHPSKCQPPPRLTCLLLLTTKGLIEDSNMLHPIFLIHCPTTLELKVIFPNFKLILKHICLRMHLKISNFSLDFTLAILL